MFPPYGDWRNLVVWYHAVPQIVVCFIAKLTLKHTSIARKEA